MVKISLQGLIDYYISIGANMARGESNVYIGLPECNLVLSNVVLLDDERTVDREFNPEILRITKEEWKQKSLLLNNIEEKESSGVSSGLIEILEFMDADEEIETRA